MGKSCHLVSCGWRLLIVWTSLQRVEMTADSTTSSAKATAASPSLTSTHPNPAPAQPQATSPEANTDKID